MARRRKVAVGVGVGVAGLLVLAALAVLVLTQTDRGRERVRSVVLERLAGEIDGQVEIRRIEGNLLSRFRLLDVRIRDEEGRPFLAADTIESRFGLRALLGRRIELQDVRIVRADVLLNKPPGEEWNYARIFRLDDPEDAPRGPGWGDWVSLEDVTLADSRVTVRDAWQPPDGLTPAEREAAIQEALEGGSREHVVEVAGGYQNVMEFRDLDAEIPRALMAHPDSAGLVFDVARLSGLVRPFSPPPARVEGLSGEFRLVRDSLFMSGVMASLDRSRLLGGGVYAAHSGDLRLMAHGSPIRFADLRWIEPRLPERGGGRMFLALEVGSVVDRIYVPELDVAIGDARVRGHLDLTTGDTVRFGPTDLRFARVETGLVERLADVDFPRRGELTGRVALVGAPRSLRVDADVRFDDAAGPTSRVIAAGGLGLEAATRFDDLRLRFAPLDAALLRLVLPDLPVGGTLEGDARLNGTPDLLDLNADLALRDPRHGLSRVRLAGGIDRRDELRLDDLVVHMEPLRLDLLRDALPELPAGATARGRVALDGVVSRALRLDGDVVLDDPATGQSGIGATGELVFGDEVRFRNLRLRFDPLQAELARTVIADLPVRGTIEGSAIVSGSPTLLELDADLVLRDPRHGLSRVRLEGGVDRREALRLADMTVEMDPLRLDLLRDEIPELPAGALASGRVRLDGDPAGALRVDGDVVVDDPATGRSEIGARGGIVFRDGLRFDDLRVRADPLRVDLVRPWIPDLPAGGAVAGAVHLNGDPGTFLHVDGQLAHHHPELGTSRLQATGGIGTAGPLEFRGLDVRMDPLDMAMVRAFAPDIPLDGTLAGTARLDGSMAGMLAVRGDVTHVGGGERSRVIGSAEIATGTGGWASVDVRLEPLSLDVAGRFFPTAGLRGTVAGRLAAAGDLGDLRLDADLRTGGGGTVRAVGTMDLAAARPGYDLDLRLASFDLAELTRRAPAATDLTGTVTARGRGLEPATMNARIVADLRDSEVDGVGADLVRLRMALEDGLARVDSSVIRLGGAVAELDGSFGLVAGREGVLAYRVSVDSLHAFAPWLPGADTAVATGDQRAVARADGHVPPRTALDREAAHPSPLLPPATATEPLGPVEPAIAAAGLGEARHYVATDGARVTETVTRVQTHIERVDSTDAPPVRHADVPRLDDDVPAAAAVEDGAAVANSVAVAGIPADSLAGSLRAAGTLRGNLEAFDADGRAVLRDLVYRGAYVGRGEVEYAVNDAGGASPAVELDAELGDVRAAGLALDTLAVDGRYAGVRGEGEGSLEMVARATDDTEYRAELDFDLSLDRREVRIADLAVRFDTVTWTMPEPGVVSWAGDEVEVASIDLRSDAGGRIRLDGRLPVDGSGDMDVVVRDLEIAQVASLLQLEGENEGLLNVDARVLGTLAAPRMEGTARLEDAVLQGEDVPDLDGTFAYGGGELTADAELAADGRVLATAKARLPVALSLAPVGVRLLDGGLEVDIRADSLPVEAIPQISAAVADASGRVRGDISIRGTFDDPIVTGAVDLDLGSVRIVPLDVRLEDVAGRLALDGDVVRVDSLVARSGGPLRVSGEIGVASLTDPRFDLSIDAAETLVIDTDDLALRVDGELAITGGLNALVVTGEVRTRRGVIRIPELSELGETEVVSLHAPTGGRRIERAFLEELGLLQADRPLLDRLHLDLAVRVDRDVWLRSTEANVEIYTPSEVGPLRVTSRGRDGLDLDGVIATDRGEYEFMSRRFDLTRGSATFVRGGGIDPVLQIAAEHEVRLPGREAFAVRLLIGGTARLPEVTLESTAQPPIAQTDLLYYLAFGREAVSLLHRQGSTLSAQGGDAGELVGNVAGLATQQLGTLALDAVASDLEEDIIEELGVDVFRITPADLPPDMFTGGYGDLLRSTEVEAGRYISSRLFVAGQLNTGASRPGIRVEYATVFGVQWRTAWRSRWLPTEPTLMEMEPRRTGVLSSFLVREWRF